MVEVLGITYIMKVYWEVSINPFKVKLLANDADVLEMDSNLPRNHYFHVYLEDVASLANYASVEPKIDVEPETTVHEDDVNDVDHVEHVDRISDVGVGVNVDSGKVEGSDEVRFDSDPESGIDLCKTNVLKKAVKMYSIKNMVVVRLKRNDNKRIQVVCKEGCQWVLWASPINFKQLYGTWRVKSLSDEHKCLKDHQNSNITSKFIAKQYLDAFHSDPNYSTRSLKQAIFKDFSIHVHLSKCIRAKNLALEKLHGNLKEQYTKLYDYLAELRSSNPGIITILQLDESVFKRLYMILEARDKGIITLAESIRSKLMQRIVKKRDEAENLTDPLCPKFQRKLDNAITQSHRCWPLRAGGSMYQVSCGPSDQHSVNIQTQTYSCRKLELTGPVGGNTRPQQRASKSPEKRAPRPKLPVKFNRGQAPTPSQFYGQNQNNIPRQPPPVHTFRRMPTPTFPSSQESYVSQSSTLVAPAQKKSRMTLKPIAIKHFFYCMYLTIAMHARFQHYDLTIVL
ncbi:hypothetical protein V6N13_100365 [Hibiscus sabdariffa]